jgi:hypothetical protein
MFINKRSGHAFEFAKEFGIKVIAYLLNQMISGEIKTEDIEKFRKEKPVETTDIKGSLECQVCRKSFANQQGVRLHMTRMHKEKQKISKDILLKEEEKNKKEGDEVCVKMEDNIEEKMADNSSITLEESVQIDEDEEEKC